MGEWRSNVETLVSPVTTIVTRNNDPLPVLTRVYPRAGGYIRVTTTRLIRTHPLYSPSPVVESMHIWQVFVQIINT